MSNVSVLHARANGAVECYPLDGLITRTADGVATFDWNGEPPEVVRARILYLKDELLGMAGAVTAFEPALEHEFVDGMYLRRLHIPAGMVLVGKWHLKACVNVVEVGDITVLTEHGMFRARAGSLAVSPAGSIKVGIAHADTVFVNIFRTDCTDPQQVEAIIASTEAPL